MIKRLNEIFRNTDAFDVVMFLLWTTLFVFIIAGLVGGVLLIWGVDFSFIYVKIWGTIGVSMIALYFIAKLILDFT